MQKSTGDMIRGFKDKDNLGCFEEFFLYGVCSEKKESKKAVYSESNNKNRSLKTPVLLLLMPDVKSWPYRR